MEISKIYKNAKDYGIPVIRTESHNFLQKITKKYNPKHILEIGTAVGYSGILMLESCDGDLTTIEHNRELIKEAKKNFRMRNLSSRATVIEGDCMVEVAKMIASNNFNNYFDMIFLDGPKAQYNLLLESLLMLLKPNGIFIFAYYYRLYSC
jgi:predicted O-methyltransferase YrrM